MVKRNYLANQYSSAHLIQLFRKIFFLALITVCVLSIYIFTYSVSDKSTTSIEVFRPIKPKTLNARNNITFPVEEVKNEVLGGLSDDSPNENDGSPDENDDSPDENMPDESKFKIAYRVTQPETTTKELELEIKINKLKDSDDRFLRLNYTEKELTSIRAVRECYRMREADANLQLFDDIEKSPPKPDKSIFFIHTTCLNSTRVTMNARYLKTIASASDLHSYISKYLFEQSIFFLIHRQACSIESAAKLNPNRDVYILFVTPVGFVKEPESPIIAALKSYQNIHFRNVDIYEFSKNTPAEQWIKQDRIFTSAFFVAHLSDYLRLIALFKFGGIYQDLDFVNIKSFDSLPPNFAPQETPSCAYINNSVLGFESNDVGHTIVERILRFD